MKSFKTILGIGLAMLITFSIFYMWSASQVKAHARTPLSPQLQLKVKRATQLLNEGIQASHAGDSETAEIKLKECIKAQGGCDAFALEELANIYQEQGRTQETIQAYHDILHPAGGRSKSTLQTDGFTRVKYALVLNKAGYWPEAVQEYNDVINSPEMPDNQEHLAVDRLRLEVRFDTSDPQPQKMQAMLHLALGRRYGRNYDAAGQQFKQALAADPNLAMAHFYSGCALQGQGREAEAQAEFGKAARLDNEGTVKVAVQQRLPQVQAHQR